MSGNSKASHDHKAHFERTVGSTDGAASSSTGDAKVPDLYACLEVNPSISPSELSRHYKRLSLLLHPDRAAYRDDPSREGDVQRRFQAITEAYDVLSDPQKRAAYDTRHGVNFRSRVTVLQEKLQRGPGGAGTGAATSLESMADLKRARGEPTVKRSTSGSDSDDDDEEYVPCASPTGVPADAAATAKPQTRLFSLFPRASVAAGHVTLLKQVNLAASSADAPAEATDCEAASAASLLRAVYGVVLEKNRLLRCSRADVPFPATVTIVNAAAVDAGDNVAAVAVHRSRCRTTDPEELELTLSYGADCFDLVGDTALLSQTAVLDSLVPLSDSGAPQPAELPTLRRGAVVLSVNDEPVQSAQELRERLRDIVSVPRSEERNCGSVPDDGTSGSNGGNNSPPSRERHRPIWLEITAAGAL